MYNISQPLKSFVKTGVSVETLANQWLIGPQRRDVDILPTWRPVATEVAIASN